MAEISIFSFSSLIFDYLGLIDPPEPKKVPTPVAKASTLKTATPKAATTFLEVKKQTYAISAFK